MTDYEIIQRILHGRIDEYEHLMKKYNYELFSFVFNMVKTYHTTEDIVQEIFIKAYEALSKYNPKKASFRTWLYRIATNHTINQIKSNQRVSLTLDDSYNDIPSDTDLYDDLEKSDEIRQILDAMTRILSTKQQKVIQLHFFSNLSPKEIHETLEIPLKSVYRIIQTSIDKLRKEVTIDETL